MLSNATFKEDLRENVAEAEEEGEDKKDTSERTINYFKQVLFTKWKQLINCI